MLFTECFSSLHPLEVFRFIRKLVFKITQVVLAVVIISLEIDFYVPFQEGRKIREALATHAFL